MSAARCAPLRRKLASSRACQPLETATSAPLPLNLPRPERPRLFAIPYTPLQTSKLSIQGARRGAGRPALGSAMMRTLGLAHGP